MVSSVSSRAPEAGRVIKDVSVASQSGSRVSADDPDAWDGSEARDDRDCHGDRLVSREERDGCLSQLVYRLGDSDDLRTWAHSRLTEFGQAKALLLCEPLIPGQGAFSRRA